MVAIFLFLWTDRRTSIVIIISARQHMMSALYAIARPSVCTLSVRPSVTRVDQSVKVELRVMHFHHTIAPYLCCLHYKFHLEIPTGSPRAGRQKEGGLGKRANIVGVLTLSPGGSTSYSFNRC